MNDYSETMAKFKFRQFLRAMAAFRATNGNISEPTRPVPIPMARLLSMFLPRFPEWKPQRELLTKAFDRPEPFHVDGNRWQDA